MGNAAAHFTPPHLSPIPYSADLIETSSAILQDITAPRKSRPCYRDSGSDFDFGLLTLVVQAAGYTG
ncbi:unnamed protein product [Diplocarpon coronariae]